jgi:hypothetical protein
MLDAPGELDPKQLEELQLELTPSPSQKEGR